MPTCPSCSSVTIPSKDDSLRCNKCKKHYHWNCTNLDDLDFCNKCNKKLPLPPNDKITCKKCLFYFHLYCTELSENKLQYHQANQKEKWECSKCVKNSCRKCNSSIHHKANIRCSVCKYTYHYTCWKIPIGFKNDKVFNSSWICPTCQPSIFPFASLNNTKLLQISNHRLEKYFLHNIKFAEYSSICNVCKSKLNNNNTGVPCSNCKSIILVKCS